MATGLMALLDDVVMLSKLAAASVDDALGQAAKAGTKAAGVVIDDAAVTPKYVVGLAPQRELPMIWKITKGSLINKLLILLPLALALDYFAPWIITPLLMLGGIYLCFEGAEKLHEYLVPHAHSHADGDDMGSATSAEELENSKVKSAVRTDFILSAEIMAITLANVSDGMALTTNGDSFIATLATKAIAIALVGIAITVVVYGVVGLIVKADDVGLRMVKNKINTESLHRLVASVGYSLVNGMPKFLAVLAAVGTAAMLWVGGSILIHGMASLGFALPEHTIHHWAEAAGASMPTSLAGTATWTSTTVLQGLLGIAAGIVAIPVVTKIIGPVASMLKPRKRT
jgi:Uncharacterized protein conserved in bacteria